MSALRAALAHFIDYAGLFPPAALDLQTTVTNHERYARSSEGWMLGRLVVPLSRLDEVAQCSPRSPALERDWTIAVLAGAGDRHRERAGCHRPVQHRREQRASPSARWRQRRPAWMHCPQLPRPSVTLERFVEVPLDATRDTWLDAVAGGAGMRRSAPAGSRPIAFRHRRRSPRCSQACAQRGLPLKTTAGLHHATRGAYRLTYEPGSPTGVMHGFLNLLVAALIVRNGGGTAADAQRALEVHDPREFTLDEEAIGWRGRTFTAAACADTRTHLLRSVGSCSFEEPVADLRALGWLPRDP